MNNLLHPDAVLYDQRNSRYIRLVKPVNDLIRTGEPVLFDNWFYRKWEQRRWSDGMWYNLEAQLKHDCRVVGRIEALVVLGIKL